jgi:hypothetical protein
LFELGQRWGAQAAKSIQNLGENMEGNVTRGPESCQNSVTEEAISERRLWTAVLVTAVDDWRMGTLRAKRSAQQFLFEDDRDFTEVCAGAGIDPSSFRSKLTKIGRKIEMTGPWSHPLAA